MADEPEEGFTVRDRRGVVGAAPVQPTTESQVSHEAVADSPVELGDDVFDQTVDETALPDVYSVLALFLGELRNLAWLRMGLVANPGTGQIERDLPQARVAIDTVAFLAEKLLDVVAPEERLPLKALVSDLQVNFVEQSKRNP